MIGAITGVLFSLTTVYLGNQMYDLLFLLFGWSQAIGKKRADLDPPPVFRKVIT
jgi:hypothetical protein